MKIKYKKFLLLLSSNLKGHFNSYWNFKNPFVNWDKKLLWTINRLNGVGPSRGMKLLLCRGCFYFPLHNINVFFDFLQKKVASFRLDFDFCVFRVSVLPKNGLKMVTQFYKESNIEKMKVIFLSKPISSLSTSSKCRKSRFFRRT